jgi:colanic acid/amylovoran biosynthesis protein
VSKIRIIGLTTGKRIGAYEQQLGNAAILIPLVKLFKSHLPEAELSTTIQLTDKFCRDYGITRLSLPKRLLPKFNLHLRFVIALFNFMRTGLWRFFKTALGFNLNFLIKGKRLEIYADSDMILDFNGDIFPSDANRLRVFSHALDIVTIRTLGIPVVEFVSSPGPFKTWIDRCISKFAFNRINVMANREPVSSELLRELGIQTPIVDTGCPAFLLEPCGEERSKAILHEEQVDMAKRPLIGMTLCGYNLPSQRTWGNLKSFDDLSVFIPTLKWLLDGLNATVFLLPHVYRSNPYTYAHEHINGPDYDILSHLYKMADGDSYNGRLKVIEGKYSPSEAKGVIGQCDLYISGRLHAGVAALSQSVPTVLAAYGHKHRGFATLVGQQKYAFYGTDPNELKSLVEEVWASREEIRKTIEEKMVRVRELVYLNIEIVGDILKLDKQERDRIPKEVSDAWIQKGGTVQA